MSESQEPSGRMSKIPYSEGEYKKNKKANARGRQPDRRRYMSNISAAIGILAFVLLFATYVKLGEDVSAYHSGSLAGRLVGFLVVAWILFAIGKALRSRFIANLLFCLVMLVPIAGYSLVLLRPSLAERSAADKAQVENMKQRVETETEAILERGGTATELTDLVIDTLATGLPEKDRPLFRVMRPVIEDLFSVLADLRVMQENVPPTPWEEYETEDQLREEAAFWREYSEANKRVLAKFASMNEELARRLLNAGLTQVRADETISGFNRGFRLGAQTQLRESDARLADATTNAVEFLADHFGAWEVDTEKGAYLFDDGIDFEQFDKWMEIFANETELQEQLMEQFGLPSPAAPE
jgi:hypothetical protein